MATGFASAPLIDAHGITKRYDGFTLGGIDLTLEPGQIVGFIGQNGAGKSTTVKALLGLIDIDGGQVNILGVSMGTCTPAEAAEVRERIGVVFDTVSMPPHLKIDEVGRLMNCAYRSWDVEVFERLLGHFRLDGSKAVKDLSRGMGMKLSLACALAHRPRLLILDEATAGLDPMARDEVLDLLREFVAAEGADGEPLNAILMSSHITSDLDKIADEVLCIDEGRIVFRCAKDEICDQMGVARCRAVDIERLIAAYVTSGAAADAAQRLAQRMLHQAYGVDVLVCDRFACQRAFPEIPCDRISIDEYMTMMLKGESVHAGVAPKRGGER